MKSLKIFSQFQPNTNNKNEKKSWILFDFESRLKSFHHNFLFNLHANIFPLFIINFLANDFSVSEQSSQKPAWDNIAPINYDIN